MYLSPHNLNPIMGATLSMVAAVDNTGIAKGMAVLLVRTVAVTDVSVTVGKTTAFAPATTAVMEVTTAVMEVTTAVTAVTTAVTAVTTAVMEVTTAVMAATTADVNRRPRATQIRPIS
jgi:hypothetical protein